MTTGRINQVSLLDMSSATELPSGRTEENSNRQRSEKRLKWAETRYRHVLQSLVLNKRQSCRVRELAHTLSFFGFLNLRSRYHDLDENVAQSQMNTLSSGT